MADYKIAIFTPEKFHPLIIGQTFLYRDINKLFTVKLLDAIGKRKPAKIITVKINICHGTLKQSLVYGIPEAVVTLNRLAPGNMAQASHHEYQN